MGYEDGDVLPTAGEVRKYPEHLSESVRIKVAVSLGPSCTSGPNGLGGSSSSSCKSQVQRNSGTNSQLLQRNNIDSKANEKEICHSKSMDRRGYSLVAKSGYQGLLSVVEACSSMAINQTSVGRYGLSCGFNSRRRNYVQGARSEVASSSYSSQGMVGIQMDDSTSSPQTEGQSCHLACRQHECKASMAEQWNLCRSVAVQESGSNANNPSRAEHKSCSCVCSVCSTSACRLDKSKESSSGLASSKGASTESVSSIWTTGSRSYGNSSLGSSISVHLSNSGLESSSSRCIYRRLESVQSSVHIPTSSNYGAGFEQDISMQKEYNLHRDKSVEEGPSLVSEGLVTVHVPSHQTANSLKDGPGFGNTNDSSREQIRRKDKIRRLEAFWRGRPEMGRLSDGAFQTLLKSWAEGTEESYGLGFRYYSRYCERNNLEGFTADPVILINFLQEQFETTTKQHSTLNSYRSAVSMTLPPCVGSNLPVGQHPLVCRFMRGVHRLRPPKVKLFPTWQVSNVLQYLLSWGSAENLPLNKLLIKTAFLVALVCFKRPADLVTDGVLQMVSGHLTLRGFVANRLDMAKPKDITQYLLW